MSDGLSHLGSELAKIPALLVEVYGDLARPGVKQVGKALETTLALSNTVLLPVEWLNEAARIVFGRNLEKFRVRMQSVSISETVTAAPEIGVPIVEKLRCVQDETLADMYIALLARASTKQTLSLSHPGFTGIVNGLSPDEANILNNFGIYWQMPIAFIASAEDRKKQIVRYVVPERLCKNVVFPGNWSAYVSNLRGLGLVNIQQGIWRTSELVSNWWQEEGTDSLLVEDVTKVLASVWSRGRGESLAYGYMELTEFGQLFQSAVRRE